MKLKSLLRGSSLDLLHSIAEFWDLRPSQPEKGQSVAALTDYLYPRLQAAPQFKQAFEIMRSGESGKILLDWPDRMIPSATPSTRR